MSLIEAVTNVAVGYVLAVATQIIVFPWFDLRPSIGQSLALGGVFVGISLLRSYALRRLFEAERFTIYAVEESGGTIVTRVKTGLSGVQSIRLPIGANSIAVRSRSEPMTSWSTELPATWPSAS